MVACVGVGLGGGRWCGEGGRVVCGGGLGGGGGGGPTPPLRTRHHTKKNYLPFKVGTLGEDVVRPRSPLHCYKGLGLRLRLQDIAGHAPESIWGFPKLGVPFSWVAIIRIRIFGGLYGGPLILRNYHIVCT